jgi:hypothetical protein
VAACSELSTCDLTSSRKFLRSEPPFALHVTHWDQAGRRIECVIAERPCCQCVDVSAGLIAPGWAASARPMSPTSVDTLHRFASGIVMVQVDVLRLMMSRLGSDLCPNGPGVEPSVATQGMDVACPVCGVLTTHVLHGRAGSSRVANRASRALRPLVCIAKHVLHRRSQGPARIPFQTFLTVRASAGFGRSATQFRSATTTRLGNRRGRRGSTRESVRRPRAHASSHTRQGHRTSDQPRY